MHSGQLEKKDNLYISYPVCIQTKRNLISNDIRGLRPLAHDHKFSQTETDTNHQENTLTAEAMISC